MKTYNIEYKFNGNYEKYKTSAMYRIPIEMNINNNQYKQEQLKFMRKLFPNGINKQIK